MGHKRDYSEDVAAVVDEEVRDAHRRPRTTRRTRSSSRTATCSTPSWSSCSRRRRSTRTQVARIFEPLRRRASASGLDGSSGRTPRDRGPCVPGRDRRGQRCRAATAANGSANGSGQRPVRTARRTADDVGHGLEHARRRPGLQLTGTDRASARSAPRDRVHRRIDHEPGRGCGRGSCCIAIGEDPEREGLLETPARVARVYAEMFAGLRQEPEDVLTTTFDLGHDELVLVRDIEV